MQVFKVILPLLPLAFLASANPSVTLDSGPIIGTTTSLPSATATVNKFLGIPFAANPTGPRRFALPQTVPKWTKPIKAQKWSPSCIQQFNYPAASRNFTEHVFNNPPPHESEDCLYLNVYAPSTPFPPDGLPVLFWIYGGGLQFGNAGQPAYDGSSFAAYQDVIIVSVNYRTNVFGFPSALELPVNARNLGLFDQRAGLGWVQRNIHLFGGSPDKVTIFGESAGAFSVDALITSEKPGTRLFRAAIMQSGQATVRAPPNNTLVTEAWTSLTRALGCPAEKGSLKCMRGKSATAIESVVQHEALEFNPIADNVTYAADPEQARVDHKIANVPVLIGNNAQEGRVFVVGDNNITTFLATSFPGAPSFQQQIAKAYPQLPGQMAYDVIAEIYTDFAFVCPTSLYVAIAAKAGIPTWRYHFNASFPNTQGFLGAGVYHSSEISIVFGTYPEANFGGPSTGQEVALSASMQSAWARFAREPMVGPGWGEVAGDLGDFGVGVSAGVTVVKQGVVDARCGLYQGIFEGWVGGV